MTLKDVPDRCHCGKPMHLSASQRVMIAQWGKNWRKEKIVKQLKGKSYKVPTYYLLIHKPTYDTLPTLGFPEI